MTTNINPHKYQSLISQGSAAVYATFLRLDKHRKSDYYRQTRTANYKNFKAGKEDRNVRKPFKTSQKLINCNCSELSISV